MRFALPTLRVPVKLAAGLATALADLVLPVRCAGCARADEGDLCFTCMEALAALTPHVAAPSPPPVGLPPCVALGGYGGPLRAILLAYKEKGRHRLASPLGDQLARGVAASVVRAGLPIRTPVILIPVPSTAAAVRARHGDHMLRLAKRAASQLNRRDWPTAIARPLAARPRVDSSHLSAAERALGAQHAFRVRVGRAGKAANAANAGAFLVAIDDVLTTGATLSALANSLAEHGVPVDAAVTLAATRRKFPVNAGRPAVSP